MRVEKIKTVWFNKVRFNFHTGSWERAQYTLPWINGNYVILTLKDILTRDDTWISRRDLIDSFETIPLAIPDAELRAQVFNYFRSMFPYFPDDTACGWPSALILV